MTQAVKVVIPQPRPSLRSLRKNFRFCVIVALTSMTCVAVQARTISGLIYPLHDITLSAGVAGLVMQRLVEPGQRVGANQVLLMLDDRMQVIESNRRKNIYEDQSELKATRERASILSTLLKDARDIFEKTGSISKDELLRLEAEYSAAKGRQEQLEAQKQRERLDYELAERERLQRQITAPVAGVVTKVIPQIGEWAKPGDPIALLVDPSTAVLHVAVPHLEMGAIKVGSFQTVYLETAGPITQTNGRVTFVSPVADPGSGLVEVRITFLNPQGAIKTGIKASIQLPNRGVSR
jgi:RND family efflux transporter MFP subunit